MREESCFSGTIEFYVPPRPPAYTPVAIGVPAVRGAFVTLSLVTCHSLRWLVASSRVTDCSWTP